eukprot:CAMPEP_0172544462 /NCGR_PEP_ID=MMETSP1067-20121228/14619_1 /TAXON_ID=265564 ORGANISM="Thalassiosira punctigera, Strain Tpunct2005C2" /NCGR_SAMPLE_ID=MMETSP1067 /ASSEMBLY_ACC=CAM_ASM_000444 /LENGTH=90 /DNA_ID=CAMNT_0013331027 /DNA_START=538 /DNA_END=810 /DNA_ORIENTATION=-
MTWENWREPVSNTVDCVVVAANNMGLAGEEEGWLGYNYCHMNVWNDSYIVMTNGKKLLRGCLLLRRRPHHTGKLFPVAIYHRLRHYLVLW